MAGMFKKWNNTISCCKLCSNKLFLISCADVVFSFCVFVDGINWIEQGAIIWDDYWLLNACSFKLPEGQEESWNINWKKEKLRKKS